MYNFLYLVLNILTWLASLLYLKRSSKKDGKKIYLLYQVNRSPIEVKKKLDGFVRNFLNK